MFFLMALVLPHRSPSGSRPGSPRSSSAQREIVAALAEVTAPLLDALAATREALERAERRPSPEAIHRVVQNGGDRLAAPDSRRRSTGCSPARRGSRWRCSS